MIKNGDCSVGFSRFTFVPFKFQSAIYAAAEIKTGACAVCQGNVVRDYIHEYLQRLTVTEYKNWLLSL